MNSANDGTESQEINDRSWTEFERRLTETPRLSFTPKCRDLRVSKKRVGFLPSLRLYFDAVLLPLPYDIVTGGWTLLSMVGKTLVVFLFALFGAIVVPPMTLARRAYLLIAALLGYLSLEVSQSTIAETLSSHLGRIRSDMECEGYDMRGFSKEITPEDVQHHYDQMDLKRAAEDQSM